MKITSYFLNTVKSSVFAKTVRNRVDRHYCARVGPAIHLNKSEVLVDEKVHITVSGLRNQQKVTILSSFKESEKTFASCGHYIADEQGEVDLDCQSSLGGSFSGTKPMGLFTSTKNRNGESRLLKGDVTTPFDVSLSVHDGHVKCDNLAEDFVNSDAVPLAMTSLKRRYLAPSARRIPLLHPEWLSGSLYLPQGEGPFPGIIEVSGQTGKALHHRAALLAPHGYAVLCLNHALYDDIPNKTKSNDYFLDACDWFSQHPMILPGGVAMVTTSSGGCISQWMAMHNDNIKTLVVINCNPFPLPGFGFNFKGTQVKDVTIDPQQFKYRDGGLELQYLFEDIDFSAHVIPIWERDVKALFIHGEDDICIPSKWTHRLEEVIPDQKKKDFKFLFYPGAGHVIDPPYSPLCTSQYHRFYKNVLLFGGKTELHLKAQEHAWSEVLAFLKEHLASRY